jgi:hypothetical protein
VLDAAFLPARNVLVAGDTEGLTGLDEEAPMLAAVGVVAVGAPALGDRGVHCLVIGPLDVFVAAGAQRPRAIAEQLLESGDVGVVAGAALAGLHRGVLNRGPLVLQVVALGTKLFLVDLVPASGLGVCPGCPGQEGPKSGRAEDRQAAVHGVSP